MKQSAMSMSIRSTGSPDPRTSNSSSTPLTSTLSMRSPLLAGSGSSNQMREQHRYGGNTPGYGWRRISAAMDQ